jgi:hypothetical protein
LLANTAHCPSALGIVAKEQGPASCCGSQNSSNFQLTYFNTPLLFFCYEPLCTSLRGFGEQLFRQRLNRKNSLTLQINKLLKLFIFLPIRTYRFFGHPEHDKFVLVQFNYYLDEVPERLQERVQQAAAECAPGAITLLKSKK